MASAREREFKRRVEQWLRETHRLRRGSERRIRELLAAERRFLEAEIRKTAFGTFRRAQLEDLERAVREASERLRRELTPEIQAGQARAFEIGQRIVAEPVNVFLPRLFADISTAQLQAAQNFVANKVTGLTDAAQQTLTQTLRRAMLGGRSMTDIISDVNRIIGGPTHGISGRALTITRTEIGRMQSVAAQLRMEQAQRNIERARDLIGDLPRLEKQWLWFPSQHPRLDHRAIDGKHIPVGDAWPVGNPPLMFPRDPAGAPEDTINCRCQQVPWVGEEAVKGPSADITPELLQRFAPGVPAILPA